MNVVFTQNAINDFNYWKTHNTAVFNKIKRLLYDISLHPTAGLGKPERLKYYKYNRWSRRITHADRLVYDVKGDSIQVIQCKGHYN